MADPTLEAIKKLTDRLDTLERFKTDADLKILKLTHDAEQARIENGSGRNTFTNTATGLTEAQIAVGNLGGTVTSIDATVNGILLLVNTAHGVDILTSGTSWGVPNNVHGIWVTTIGGGGGGGSSAAGGGFEFAGAGGGAGGVFRSDVSVTPGASISYSIGAGGAASTDGNDTTFTGATTAPKGIKGGTGSGSGGTGGGSNCGGNSGPGGNGAINQDTGGLQAGGGAGGGNGGPGGRTGVGGNAAANSGGGGGGGGSVNGGINAGGSGGSGAIVIEY